MSEIEKIETSTYSVFAEIDGSIKPLIQINMSFGRLMDDIVVPFQNNKSFFIDGVVLTKEKINRFKIIRNTETSNFYLNNLHHRIPKHTEMTSEQYYTQLDVILRGHGDDVTSQVITAYEKSIGSKIKEYLPNKEELIKATYVIFVESMKLLNK